MRDLVSPFAAGFTPGQAAALAATLKVLAEPQRLRIVSLLHSEGALGPVELAGHLGLSQPTVSHHLRILDAAGLTRWHQDGSHYRRTLDVDALAELALLLRPRGVR